MIHPVAGLDADVEWEDGVDPESWRDAPEGDNNDNDEDNPIEGDVEEILGFDPDEEPDFNSGDAEVTSNELADWLSGWDDEFIVNFNPFHDNVGRFATRQGTTVSKTKGGLKVTGKEGGHLGDVSQYTDDKGRTMFSARHISEAAHTDGFATRQFAVDHIHRKAGLPAPKSVVGGSVRTTAILGRGFGEQTGLPATPPGATEYHPRQPNPSHALEAVPFIKREKVTKNPVKVYNPDVKTDANKDGVTDAARVGVPARQVPPPPSLKPLPNLTPTERKIETEFNEAFNKNTGKMVDDYHKLVMDDAAKGGVPTFGTDDAKMLHHAWRGDGITLEQRAINRATLNCSLHQAANAITKRAFLKHLDTLKPGDEVLVTVGGCGAGKGYALKNVPQALEMKKRAKAVWDSAGDQNATENPWIHEELVKRGLVGNYVYVHADPYKSWADPSRGVVKRAGSPEDGRMVDAHVFADSYDLGAKNHQAFYDKYKGHPNANFVFLENKGTPTLLPGIPKEGLDIDAAHLAKFAVDQLPNIDAPPHVKRGASIGLRIWGDDTRSVG